MTWISIDEDRCNLCGACVARDPLVYRIRDNKLTCRADETTCNLCGGCVAVCPEKAITHHMMDMDNFIEFDENLTVDTASLIQLIRKRRSHRSFRNKKIPRKDLETLVDASRYAPTGSNVQDVEVLVIQDPERIQKLSSLTVDFFAEGPIPEELKFTLRQEGVGQMFVRAREAGIDTIFHRAPAIMIFHHIAPSSLPKDNCVIAAHTVVLTAMTLGLETCYIGLFQVAANYYAPLIKDLDIPSDHEVYSVLALGYPRLNYYRTVDRTPTKVRWE